MEKPALSAESLLRTTSQDALTEVLRNGVQRLLAEALEVKVETYLAAHSHLRDVSGYLQVVRNCHCPERSVQTPIGDVPVKRPWVNDRRTDADGGRIRFTSQILPPYLRRSKSIENLVPWLYLKGISTGDFSKALVALPGDGAHGLSASTIVRLKTVWEEDFRNWSERDLNRKRYGYVWVDGIHFNVGLEGERQYILVVMVATENETKELLAVHDGVRESEQSWSEVLLDLKARGLVEDPMVADGDGALCFWRALPKVWPTTRPQRCWGHKMGNVLNKLPNSAQPYAKSLLQQIRITETKQDAETAFNHFIATYDARYPKATECLAKDRKDLLVFYDFPAEHWAHLRTTNPIESTFATVRLRTKKTKGSGSRIACLTMVIMLAKSAEAKWRKLNGYELLGDVIRGVKFVDGIREAA